MKELSGQRGWEHVYRKKLEGEIELLRDALEDGEGRTMDQYHYLCGKLRGFKLALHEMADAREKFKLDDDAD